MSTWEKETTIQGGPGGCLHCGYQHSTLPLDALIAVGFGEARVTKDGETVFDELDVYDDMEKCWHCRDAEEAACADPDHDWRIHLVAPLSERHYQRQGVEHWVLFKKGIGFA